MTDGNKLADLLTIYLYKNKYLSLPKLGRFQVSEDVDLSQPETVEFSRIPKGVISFTPKASEETDIKLVRYITEHTRKMQSLAVADLFTLTDQAGQMLNIFQPVSFAGIGTLTKNIRGEIVFTPGAYKAELLSSFSENTRIPDYAEKPVSVAVYPESNSGNSSGMPASRSLGGIVIIAICVIVAGVLVYFMFSQGGRNDNLEEVTEVHKIPVSDSLQKKPEEVAPPVRRTGVIHYEVVFEHNVDSARAFYRYNELTGWGHTVIMHTKDSIHYSLAIPFTTNASDTTKAKDSIRILYGKPTTIRYKTRS